MRKLHKPDKTRDLDQQFENICNVDLIRSFGELRIKEKDLFFESWQRI